MELNSKIPLVVTEKNSSFVLEGKTLTDMMETPRPILWNREGLYGWISIIQMRNAVRIAKDKIKAADNNYVTLSPTIICRWNDTISTIVIWPLAQAIEEMFKLIQ